jgi:hypothetical protein
MSDAADQRIAELEREVMAVQEMLAAVLTVIDRPVVVEKTVLANMDRSKVINIEIDPDQDTIIFQLVDADEQ